MILFLTVLEVYRTCYNWVLNTTLLTIVTVSTLLCKIVVTEQPLRIETAITTAFGTALGIIIIALILQRHELYKRFIATFGSDQA